MVLACLPPTNMSDQPVRPVSISYGSLLEEDLSFLHDDILRAFGSSDDSLGLIVLQDLPAEFGQLRENAMRSAARFASLPEHVREKYTDPASSYSFGWSHGCAKCPRYQKLLHIVLTVDCTTGMKS